MDPHPDSEPPPLPDPVAAPESQPGVVLENRPCLKCGYSLQGLGADGVCPECGAPVIRSLRGNLLEFADSTYTRVLHIGAIVVEVGAFAPFAAGLLTVLVYVAARGFDLSGGSFSGTGRGDEMAGRAIELLGASVSIVGWWLFSQPDPAQVGADPGEKARRVVRILLCVRLGLALLLSIGQFIPAVSRYLFVSPVGGGAPAGVPVSLFVVQGFKLIDVCLKAGMMCAAMIYFLDWRSAFQIYRFAPSRKCLCG